MVRLSKAVLIPLEVSTLALYPHQGLACAMPAAYPSGFRQTAVFFTHSFLLRKIRGFACGKKGIKGAFCNTGRWCAREVVYDVL